MKKIANPYYQQQEIVNTYFQSQSAFWKDKYESNEVYAEKQSNRYATMLAWGEQELAIQEMACVMKSGGYLILTADNRAQLNILLDPWLNPALAPLKQRVMKDALDRPGLRRKSLDDLVATSHSWHFIDLSLKRVELIKTRSTTLGFGPFLFLHRTIHRFTRHETPLSAIASRRSKWSCTALYWCILHRASQEIDTLPDVLSPSDGISISTLQKYYDNDE